MHSEVQNLRASNSNGMSTQPPGEVAMNQFKYTDGELGSHTQPRIGELAVREAGELGGRQRGELEGIIDTDTTLGSKF